MVVIKLTGKAREVFGIIKLMAERNPNKTLREIIKEGGK